MSLFRHVGHGLHRGSLPAAWVAGGGGADGLRRLLPEHACSPRFPRGWGAPLRVQHRLSGSWPNPHLVFERHLVNDSDSNKY